MDVRFYRTESGTEPVREYLRSLPKEQRAIVGRALRAIQTLGLGAAQADVKQVRGKLWEVRASYQRVFYVVAKGGVMWLLHAYEKDTQKAPAREIETAERRMREVLAQK